MLDSHSRNTLFLSSSQGLLDFLKTRPEKWIAGVVEKYQLMQ